MVEKKKAEPKKEIARPRKAEKSKVSEKKIKAKPEKKVKPAKKAEALPEAPAKAVPEKVEPECTDKKCPIHSGLKTHGRVFVGVVISDKMRGTVNVEWPRKYYIPKFERYEARRSRVKAHNPACIAVKLGDRVKIAECRPLSKTVKFVVVEVMK